MSSSKPTILLTPGAWHSPAYFAAYRSALEAHHYPTESLDLPSVNADPTLQSHDKDTIAIRQHLTTLIEEQGKDVVLVMHSYSGIPASDAAEGLGHAERMAAGKKGGIVLLVYICAYMMPVGESLFSYEGAFGMTEPAKWQRLDVDKGRLFVTEYHNSLYNGLSEDVIAEWAPQLGHQSLGSFTSVTKYAPFKKIDTLYIQCNEDNALLPDRQTKMIEATGLKKWVKLRTGHTPFLLCPDLLSDITRAATGETVVMTREDSILVDDIGSAMVSLKVK